MTNKNKNILLVIGFILVIIVCYILAFSKTMNLKNDYNDLKKEELLFKNTPKQLSLLMKKQRYYDSLLNKYQVNGGSIQNNLLRTINDIAGDNNLKVVRFLEPHSVENNNLTVKTYQFTVQGNYNNILKLIHHLEQKTKFGEIVNFNFEKKKNYRTNKYYLQASVLLKSFG